MSARRTPVQRRSRERVDQILATASDLLRSGGVEALTTRSLAAHSGIPVATIYRYFENRDAIIDAYLDRDLKRIEESITAELLATELVTFRSMIRAFAEGHFRYHHERPESVPIWFGGRLNPAVSRKVRELDARHAASLALAARRTGMVERAPSFIAELLVRLFDRTFEFIYASVHTVAEQEQVLESTVDMATAYMERFATPAGLTGVPAVEFVRFFTHGDDAEPPSRDGAKPNLTPLSVPVTE